MLTNIFYAIIVLVISYLIGSISFACLITKWKIGKDIRDLGSGNAGFTNTLRVLPKKWAFTVFAGDCLKGTLAALIGAAILGTVGGLIAAIGVLLGHMYPIFYGFRGGKGVATAFGVGLALVTIPALIGIILFGIVLYTTKYMSLSSMVGVTSSFFTSLIVGEPALYVLITFILSVATLYKHKDNIHRLRTGTERKLGQK